MLDILFAHGLEGHPRGTKAQHLHAAGFSVTAPDGRGKVLADRVQDLIAASARQSGLILVGSSYGGLGALALLAHDPSPYRGVVLCAPALHWSEPPVARASDLLVPSSLPCIVLHGLHDTVVPIEASRALTRRSPHVRLLELDDDHRLNGSLDVLVRAVREVAGGS